MWSRTRFSGLGLAVFLAVLVASPPAVAAPRPISGKLSKPGFTVIALAADGEARVVRASGGRFKLRPPTGRVTLHLRAPTGKYAGPIVIGRTKRGRRAILGVRAGARLGRVGVRRGYANLSRRLRGKWVDASRVARARRGVPIGVRVFGRVLSPPPRNPIPGDGDLDGVPDPLDIDDDGDLILDDADRSTGARAAQAGSAFHLFSDLILPLERSVNHNAGSSDPAIDAALPSRGNLLITILPGDSAELDCGGANQIPPRAEGLVYCTSGGTGRLTTCPDPTNPCQSFPPFPGDPGGPYDLDGDGFGSLTTANLGAGGALRLEHRATSAQIGTGDVLIQHVATGVPESQCPPPSAACASFTSTLGFVFATVPALISYSDGAGNAATVSYAVDGGTPPTPPFQVAPCPPGAPAPCVEGDVVLTLTYWRPQRRPMPDEPGYGDPTAWTDIGALAYGVAVGDTGALCPQTSFSTTDPNLRLATPNDAPGVFNQGRGGFVDQALAQPASTANTFTFSLNLSNCQAANGLAFGPGERQGIGFEAHSPNFGGRAGQVVTFQRSP